MQLERKGKPTVTIITEPFVNLARSQSRGLETPSLPTVVIPHPIVGLSPDKVRQRLDGRLDLLVEALVAGGALEKQSNAVEAIRGERIVEGIEIDNTLGGLEEANDFFRSKCWTDGLPIIPPTEAEVQRFVSTWGRDSDSIVAVIPPAYGLATLEKIAVNMVMAGCEPTYLPVIEAALLAMSEEPFCLINSLTGTGMQSPLAIVSGPIRNELSMNYGLNAFGQGCRSNATIGRALRLIFVNVGGCVPGILDRSTQGHPGKYSFVLVENEEASPWPPVHVDYGFDRKDSVVTVVTGQPPCLIKDSASTSGLGILYAICSAMAVPDSVNYNQFGDQVLVLCPEHAATLASDGFSKDEIRRFVWENARVPVTKFTPAFIEKIARWRFAKRFNLDNPSTMIPILEKPEDLIVVVAGGAGKHSSFVPTYCQSRRVSRKIT